jgi:ribonuclease-3
METYPSGYKKFQDLIEYKFNNIELLIVALTHKSFTSENLSEMHNEHLEFLGDSVISLVLSTEIYNQLENKADEGIMTKIRASLINRDTLAQKGNDLHLGDYLRLGKGEDSCEGRKKEKILANAFEALIGALYLDSGFEKIQKFIKKIYYNELKNLKMPENDYKSKIQEFFQEKYHKKPIYHIEEVTDETLLFKATLFLDDVAISTGTGKNKKNAEKEAAKNAIEVLLN